MNTTWKKLLSGLMAVTPAIAIGCAHCGWSTPSTCNTPVCEASCEPACEPCGDACGQPSACGNLHSTLCGWMCRRSNSIPDTLPLGHTVRSHYQTMETNGEAVDFILNLNDFVGSTATLTPDGKDKILEIAARMRSQPFPVLIERSYNNSDPELDMLRRNLVAQILTDLGNPDAAQRTVVATAYGPGYNSQEAETMYMRHTLNGVGNGNNGGGFGGGFGGGGGGGFF